MGFLRTSRIIQALIIVFFLKLVVLPNVSLSSSSSVEWLKKSSLLAGTQEFDATDEGYAVEPVASHLTGITPEPEVATSILETTPSALETSSPVFESVPSTIEIVTSEAEYPTTTSLPSVETLPLTTSSSTIRRLPTPPIDPWKSSPSETEDEDATPVDGELPDPIPTRASSHQRFLTIMTMVKNQRRWLREWLEFYLMMGVEHFYIYDNESKDYPLEILQPYIDDGIVTYIQWPRKDIPPPPKFKTKLEQRQYQWFSDQLLSCMDDDWTMHKQGPCQLAAFADAVRRNTGGVTRWLASIDVDEFMFPRPQSNFTSIAEMLQTNFADEDHVTVWGGMFGANGHKDWAARREPGEPLQALVTESYTRRAKLHNDDYPYEGLGADDWVIHGKGALAKYQFGKAYTFSKKSFADPDMVYINWIHVFYAAKDGHWKTKNVWNIDKTWKFNHYAYLSEADAKRKAENNRNPFMVYSPKVEEFFSREEDTEILYYVPELKQRMLSAIERSPPPHPDDWMPPNKWFYDPDPNEKKKKNN